MTIIRVKKETRYFTASNEPFNDKRLSWEARGLIGYLLSKPNNWQVRMESLMNEGPAGLRKVRRMLAELRKYGYMNRKRISHENRFTWVTEIYESPSLNKSSSIGTFCIDTLPTGGKRTDILNTEGINTNKANEDEDAAKLAKISRAYEQEIGVITAMIADELQDAAKSYPEKWVLDAIHEAAVQNKRGWKYVLAILKRWTSQGNQQNAKPQPQARQGATPPPSQPKAVDAAKRWLEKRQAANG